MTRQSFSSGNCGGNVLGTFSVGENECWARDVVFHSLTLPEAGAACADGTVTANIPEATWGTALVACAPPDDDAVCPDGSDVCVPTPTEPLGAELCVVRAGDHECPAAYPTRTLYYHGLDDTRACPDSCECTPTGATCSIRVERHEPTSCIDLFPPAVTVQSGSTVCVLPNATYDAARTETVQLDDAGACTPGSADLGGDVTPTAPVTVCCM
jgi:hypothetical protein